MRCYGFSRDVPSRQVKRGCYNALGLNKEGHVADIIDDSTCVIGMLGNLSSDYDSADDARLCLTTSYFELNYVNTSQKPQENVNFLDDRMITADQLRAKVCEKNILSPQQQKELYGVLIKYQQHLTKRPGRCKVFEYEFKIEGDMPPTANSRPIPFALRAPVREQIQVMLRDGILEELYSAYFNPLTLVHREPKPIRICVENKQADGSRSRQCTAYARTVTEISWTKLHNEFGPQQRIYASSAKQGISEMDRLPIPE